MKKLQTFKLSAVVALALLAILSLGVGCGGVAPGAQAVGEIPVGPVSPHSLPEAAVPTPTREPTPGSMIDTKEVTVLPPEPVINADVNGDRPERAIPLETSDP